MMRAPQKLLKVNVLRQASRNASRADILVILASGSGADGQSPCAKGSDVLVSSTSIPSLGMDGGA